MTWEKITATNANYSTGTTKAVNTSGFLLNQLRYYYTTTNYAAGAKIATNYFYEKAPSVDMRYSTNCGSSTDWALGDYIYLVGTLGVDGLFYLDTTKWWTNDLPTTNDGKLYIRLGLALAAAGYTMSFFEDRPIFYHNGTKICEYKLADNKQDTLVSGTNIKTINNQSVLGSGNLNLDGLPSQSGQSGKYLTTNGSTASWATVDVLPSQTSQSGKFLTTNGTTASWTNIPTELPSQSGQNGKYLKTDGSSASWATVDTLPSQSGQSGKYLTTNGSAASWASLATVAASGSYNDLSNKLTAGTDITISSNQISCTYPEVYITEEDYQDLVDAGTVDPNTYYNTDDATQMTVTDFITKKDSMNPGDQLPQGYLVFVEVQ